MGTVTIGVDIGQRVDPTAIAVVEREERIEKVKDVETGADRERRVWHHTTRHLERLPLGTSYPDVARRLVAVTASVTEKTGRRPRLYVDATGVGKPVVDVLKDHKVYARLTAVYFTYGDRRMQGDDGSIILGKAYLVSRLQALFQGERLHLSRHDPEAETMTRELLDYEIRISKDANLQAGAFRVGTHDDLVTALGLATQVDGPVMAGVLARSLAGTAKPVADPLRLLPRQTNASEYARHHQGEGRGGLTIRRPGTRAW
jgi:hypothetical protein